MASESNAGSDVGIDVRMLRKLAETFREDGRRGIFHNLSHIIQAREKGILKLDNKYYQSFLRGEIPFYSGIKQFSVTRTGWYIDNVSEEGYRIERNFSLNVNTFDVFDAVGLS